MHNLAIAVQWFSSNKFKIHLENKSRHLMQSDWKVLRV